MTQSNCKVTSKQATAESLRRMYTPERVTAAVRVTGALWTELGRRLRELRVALDACGAGGEAPVLMCRARVKLMLAAWRALTPDGRALLASPSGDDEHFRWMDEYAQVMKQWLATFEHDLAEYGTTKENEDPDEGLSFVPEVAVALGLVVEVYDDWSLIAWPLSTIDAPCEHEESEIKKFDVDLRRVGKRMRVRRAAHLPAERDASRHVSSEQQPHVPAERDDDRHRESARDAGQLTSRGGNLRRRRASRAQRTADAVAGGEAVQQSPYTALDGVGHGDSSYFTVEVCGSREAGSDRVGSRGEPAGR